MLSRWEMTGDRVLRGIRDRFDIFPQRVAIGDLRMPLDSIAVTWLPMHACRNWNETERIYGKFLEYPTVRIPTPPRKAGCARREVVSQLSEKWWTTLRRAEEISRHILLDYRHSRACSRPRAMHKHPTSFDGYNQVIGALLCSPYVDARQPL